MVSVVTDHFWLYGSLQVREDRAKLVVKREVIVLGTYVHSDEIAVR